MQYIFNIIWKYNSPILILSCILNLNFTEEEIIKGIASTSEKENNEVFRFFYKEYFPLISHFIIKNSGTEKDAEDLFQDTVIVFYKKLKHGNLTLSCSIKTYLYSVCRNLWLKKLKDHKRISDVKIEDLEVPADIDIDAGQRIDVEERNEILAKLFDKLGSRCKKILLFFYYQGLSMEEIQKQFGYKSVQVAKNEKYKCMKRLATMISKNMDLQSKLKTL